MKKYSNWLFVTFCLFFLSALFTTIVSAEGKPTVVQGQLDLRNDKIMNYRPIELNGEWEFYWKKLLTFYDFKGDHLKSHTPYYVDVPNTWHNYEHNNGNIPKYGYATYRISLLFNEADLGQLVSLYVPSVATAYNLWVDDRLIASNGKVGKSRDEMIPKNYSKVATFEVKNTTTQLLFQVSNFNQRKAGLWEPIILGEVNEINQLSDRNILVQMFVIGCIFIIGIYHLVLFRQRPKEIAPLYLAITCFGVSLRTLLLKDTLLIKIFPQISWEVAVHLEYFSALLALLFFFLFIEVELFPIIPRMITIVFVTVYSIYSLFVLVTPAYIFTNTFWFFKTLVFLTMLSIVIITFIGIRQKRPGARLNGVVMIILFVAILNDIFYYSHLIPTDEFVSIGLVVYLFAQSIHLARRSSQSFDKVERLSKELQVLNHSLERKVQQRTNQLQVTNNKLQGFEVERRQLLASISDELKVPFSFVQINIKAMMDEKIDQQHLVSLKTIYRHLQTMAYLIYDLEELSNLESKQVAFQLERIEIRNFLFQLFLEEKAIMAEKGIEFLFEEELFDKNISRIYCLLDPVRIKQAIINLIHTVMKHTQVGGVITIRVEIPDKKEIKVSVQDTGMENNNESIPYSFFPIYRRDQQGNDDQLSSGLELAIAKEIIEYHEGIIGVKNENGKGSNYYFILAIQSVSENGNISSIS